MKKKLLRWLDELADPNVYPLAQGVITIIALSLAIIVGWVWYLS